MTCKASKWSLCGVALSKHIYNKATDVGIVGGAGIRSGIKAGDITANDAATVLSLGGYISSAEVTGQQILDTLELASTAYPEEKPMFLQVSGIEYTIDESVKSGVQLDENGRFLGVDGEYRIKDVIINGEPLNTDKTYTLAADSAFLNGGYLFTDNCKIIKDSVMKDSEILTAYIHDYLGGYIPEKYSEPYGEGRIKVVTAAPSVNGDINADGIFDEADIIALQDWLVCVPGAEPADSEAADICSDGILNVFDLCALKRELSYQKMMYTRLKKLVRNF